MTFMIDAESARITHKIFIIYVYIYTTARPHLSHPAFVSCLFVSNDDNNDQDRTHQAYRDPGFHS